MPRVSRIIRPVPAGASLAPGALDNWNAAKMAGGILPVVNIGDSIGAGGVATNYVRERYPRIFTDLLMARYGSNGRFWQAQDCAQLNAPTGSPVPWVLTTTAGAWQNFRWLRGREAQVTAAQTAASAIFTSPVPCTDMDVYYRQNPTGGTFNLLVDGSVVANLTCLNATDQEFNVYQATGLANTTHTVELRSTQTLTTMQVQGVYTYTNAGGRLSPGIQDWTFASAGALMTSVTDQYVGAGNAAWDGWHAMIVGCAAKLVLVEFGANEANGSTDQTTCRRAQMDGLNFAALQGASYVYIGVPSLAAGSGNLAFSQLGIYQAQYAAQALAYGGAAISFLGMGGASPATYISAASIPHPNTAGHLLMGQRLFSWLG
jgi:hypothetical protein